MTHTENAAQPGPAAGSPAPSSAPGRPDDPRPALVKAVALTGHALAGVRPEQFDAPTPCAEYTVRQLAGHLVAVLRRIAFAGRGGDAASLPLTVDDVADADWSQTWDATVREFEAGWADPEILGRTLNLPFGTVPGAVAALIWTSEFTVHTWDLATATGQHPSWDPEIVELSLTAMRRALPQESRPGAPFDAAVDVAADAPAIDRLVAWCGRRP